jgi:hypothetical protein
MTHHKTETDSNYFEFLSHARPRNDLIEAILYIIWHNPTGIDEKVLLEQLNKFHHRRIDKIHEILSSVKGKGSDEPKIICHIGHKDGRYFILETALRRVA